MPAFFLFRKRRYFRSKGTGLNPLDKGKSFNGTRYKPLFQDINLIVDRPESCVGFWLKGRC